MRKSNLKTIVVMFSLALTLGLWPGLALAVEEDGSNVGSEELLVAGNVVSALTVQATNNTQGNATTIPVNKATSDNLTSSSDANWYKFTLSSAGKFSLVFDSDYGDSSSKGWNVTLYDSEQSSIWEGSFLQGGTLAKTLTTTGLPAGAYYVRVAKIAYINGWTGDTYRITPTFKAASDWETEFNGRAGIADDIPLNATTHGTLKSGSDEDWFKVSLPEAGRLDLVFDSDYGDSSSKGWNVTLYDSEQSSIWEGSFLQGGTEEQLLTSEYLSAGTYYVRVAKIAYINGWTGDIYLVTPGFTSESELAAEAERLASLQPMHRFYNPYTGEHFYTSDDSESNNLIDAGWTLEGDGWEAPPSSNLPVYRMYNSYAGEHHYTMDSAECDSLVDAGWTYEGVGWYSAGEDGVPLYRVYNPKTCSPTTIFTRRTRMSAIGSCRSAGMTRASAGTV